MLALAHPVAVNSPIQFLYLLEVASELTQEEVLLLSQIVSDGRAQVVTEFGAGVFISPRLGTISPWSSKATDILQNAGLHQVQRVEWARFYPGQDTDPGHDPMLESLSHQLSELEGLFLHGEPAPLQRIPLADLAKVNLERGFGLSPDEIAYLRQTFSTREEEPTDVELMMFAQLNSEHCRHKIFNADWEWNGQKLEHSLFAMIRHTHQSHPQHTLSAYKDNAAVTEGRSAHRFFPNPDTGEYEAVEEPTHLLMKVETHNHPTGISPFPGAATGSGGEIRDEAATGIGAKPKAGFCGFMVSNLRIPGFIQSWEKEDYGKPGHMASPLKIMLDGPIGAAAFNNEFGRPALGGFFRTLELHYHEERRGYHKPLMLAGGWGDIRAGHVQKGDIPAGSLLIVLGGPAMRIGLGGGAASSQVTGAGDQSLDFASVQRGNPEMQRRAQEVIDRCWHLGEANPILSIHDVGAGGLSNAMPELVHDAGRGARLELRHIPNAEPAMAPHEVWSNEAQERYVLAIAPQDLPRFDALCQRERCPYAVLGEATEEPQLVLTDRHHGNAPVRMSLDALLGKPPRLTKVYDPIARPKQALDLQGLALARLIEQVLQAPAVASKKFLITIGDRTVGGMTARDPLVGPWQTPVADCMATCFDYQGFAGEVAAVGERSPVALLHPAASGRLAVGEALTNLASAWVSLEEVKLSANWMSAASHPGEGQALYDTVKAVALELCPTLGVSIPVGKDSMSMKAAWDNKAVTSPLSLVISAFAPSDDVRKIATPDLKAVASKLYLLDLGQGKNRLGGSILAQVLEQMGEETPDLDDAGLFKGFFSFMAELHHQNMLLAYHDRSDGGLLATLLEMAFAGHTGLDISLDGLGGDPTAILFAEELGAVVQIAAEWEKDFLALAEQFGQGHILHALGHERAGDECGDRIVFRFQDRVIYEGEGKELHKLWAQTSFHLQALRDDADCAQEEFAALGDEKDPGLLWQPRFDPEEKPSLLAVHTGAKPKVAILREQGVNGHVEMAAAFTQAGFLAVDIHMTDLIENGRDLAEFKGLVACGGFSYGDVLGAGLGWANSILHHANTRDAFSHFFARADTFALGVCNGCQMFSHLRSLIPGAAHWPRFVRNRSRQFEARLSLVEIMASPSIFLQNMEGSVLPIAVAHGEGRIEGSVSSELGVLRYVDHHACPTERYPFNPNGSANGLTGFTTDDGRFTIMMPHPERLFRTVQYSWSPRNCGERGPWMRMFDNAREWVA